ncbi:MAG TPA: ORF6N domain-containing protein [Caulobacter sp.]|nr:ORF6N domain-containing protein [Caulobacter sp.]
MSDQSPPAPHLEAGPPSVLEVRGCSVILDADLARLFNVETKQLNQQVRRNTGKFEDFAFQLTAEEFKNLRSQNVTSSPPHGGRRYQPYAFTEHGVVMAATVMKSETAIAASRFIIKVFVEARRTTLVSDGANLPSLIDARGLLPLQSEARTGLRAS